AADAGERGAAGREAGGFLEAGGVTALAVGVLRLALLLERRERARVARVGPQPVLLRVTALAGGRAHVVALVEERAVAVAALGEQRLPLGERQVLELLVGRVRDQGQPLREDELQRVLRVVTRQADRLEAGLGELRRLVRAAAPVAVLALHAAQLGLPL